MAPTPVPAEAAGAETVRHPRISADSPRASSRCSGGTVPRIAGRWPCVLPLLPQARSPQDGVVHDGRTERQTMAGTLRDRGGRVPPGGCPRRAHPGPHNGSPQPTSRCVPLGPSDVLAGEPARTTSLPVNSPDQRRLQAQAEIPVDLLDAESGHAGRHGASRAPQTLAAPWTAGFSADRHPGLPGIAPLACPRNDAILAGQTCGQVRATGMA